MDSLELAEWLAYDRLDPIGAERADLRIGILTAMYKNAHRKKADREAEATDYLLCQHDDAKKHDTPEAMQAHLRMVAQVANRGRKRR